MPPPESPAGVPPAAARPLGERERFVAFAFAAADLLVELDATGRIAFAAGAFRARLGRAPEELVGTPAEALLAAEERAPFAAAVALLPGRGRLPPTAFHLADPARTPMAVSGLVLTAAGAAPRLCLAFAPMPLLREEALADGRALRIAAQERLRLGGPPPALGVVEIAGLGDEALSRRVEALLQDGIGPGTLAARMAPGRYGLLVEEADALPDLPGLAGRLERALLSEGHQVRIAAAPLDLGAGGLTPAQAAKALRHGLDAFARFGAEGLREAGFESGLAGVVGTIARRAAGLRRAIAQRRFRLEFQPIVALDTGAVHHHEALLRPAPDLLRPGETAQDFVALAETIGLTPELDLAVATLALAAVPALQPGRRVAFNISGLSAQSPGFRAALLGLLDADPRGAKGVMVELTESAEIEDEAAAAETLRSLRGRGVPVCIDDFGAGAAAFRYLKAFDADYVKVDGAFVQAALTSERDRAFVASMVDLSLAVGAQVVAERIETAEAAAAMRALGVHYGQGWHFGRPGAL